MKGRVNASETKVMRCRVIMGQDEILVVFARRELVEIQSCAWGVTVGFIKSVVASQKS